MRDGLWAGVALSDAVATDWRTAQSRLLAVGDKTGWLSSQKGLPDSPSITYMSIEDITKCLLHELAPDLIVSPVLCRAFDCIDLSLLLSACEYQGAYRAVGGDLPRPQMIENEIRQLCPHLDFAIVASV